MPGTGEKIPSNTCAAEIGRLPYNNATNRLPAAIRASKTISGARDMVRMEERGLRIGD